MLEKTPFSKLVLLILLIGSSFADDILQQYVDTIEKAIEDANSYELPEDATEFKASGTPTEYGSFDFIVVGAGSAGTVIANRLSEVGDWSVLLLEAGGWGNNRTDIPALFGAMLFSEYNWGFKTVPQETSCQGTVERLYYESRGRGIGGTSLINGLAYIRGSSLDFDRWAEIVNDTDWSYDNVLPYFLKSENYNEREVEAPIDENVHAKGGYLNVEFHVPSNAEIQAFLDANLELGYPVKDFNSGTGIGASPTQYNTRNGRRGDGGTNFINPVFERTNLKVQTGAYVTKIHIDSDTLTASGVNFTLQGKTYYVNAEKEIILSAGTINDPQILMLSGIGPKEHLESLKIDVKVELEVGSSYHDHPVCEALVFCTNYTGPLGPIEPYVEEFLNGTGPLTLPGNNAALGFYESSFTKGTGLPDFELLLVISNSSSAVKRKSSWTTETSDAVFGDTDSTKCFRLPVFKYHTASTGTIRLNSSDPFEYPLIDPRHLSDSENKDIQVVYEGLQIAIQLINTTAYENINATLALKKLPQCSDYEYLSKDYWYCVIRYTTSGGHHPTSSCKMGSEPEKGAVVDSRFKVHGVKQLRIADASVFPFSVSGHTHANVVMVAEKVSDYIKSDYDKVM